MPFQHTKTNLPAAPAQVTTSPTSQIASNLNDHCPAIEVWGVNVYGSVLERLPAKMRELGFTRAYCVTEYGPTNWWQARFAVVFGRGRRSTECSEFRPRTTACGDGASEVGRVVR